MWGDSMKKIPLLKISPLLAACLISISAGSALSINSGAQAAIVNLPFIPPPVEVVTKCRFRDGVCVITTDVAPQPPYQSKPEHDPHEKDTVAACQELCNGACEAHQPQQGGLCPIVEGSDDPASNANQDELEINID
jgi:hypothetical protein